LLLLLFEVVVGDVTDEVSGVATMVIAKPNEITLNQKNNLKVNKNSLKLSNTLSKLSSKN
jgi:hypothetical protein